MKLKVIIEKHGNLLWGYIVDMGHFLPATGAKTTREILKNLKEAIREYQLHEGKEDGYWQKVIIDNIEWVIRYDLQAFFEQLEYLNITAIAKRAGLNPTLVRRYRSGLKFPSALQVKKLEHAVHCIAEELRKVRVRME